MSSARHSHSLIDRLRQEADVSEKGLAFMDDPDLVAETEIAIALLRDAATAIETAAGATHTDAELERPEDLSDSRLVEIVAECLRRWDAYPLIPGAVRWKSNGITALVELETRMYGQGRRQG